MTSPYGSHFDGTQWPWELVGDADWLALHDASGRYVSDACVEGNAEQWREAAAALRGRHDFYVKRLGIDFKDGQIRLWSPRNSVGGYAVLPVDLADALADVIDAGLRAVGAP